MLERFEKRFESQEVFDVVLVLGGTNDVLQNVPLETTLANLQAIHRLASQQSMVGILGLPIFLPQIWGVEEHAASRRLILNAKLKEQVAGYSFPSFFVDLESLSPSYLYDGLHFTNEGYQQLAFCVGRLIADPSLRPLLDKQGLRKGLERTMSGPDQLQDEVWQDREIKFDQMPQLLKLRKGEFQIDSINSVEDTKGNNGERGILIVTNLRLIWTSAKYARTNLSIGFNCVSSVNIRTVTSKLRGNSQALYVMTRFNSTRFEFIFTSLVKHSPRLFTTVQAVFKSYETTKLYRDLKLRGAIIRDKELIMLPNEQVYERINGIWNLSSDQGTAADGGPKGCCGKT
eukprot:symbB.v1.2.007927.t3/scaffold495.1/size259991/11